MKNVDLTILKILQEDARISNAELARQLGMAPSAVLERVRKLEERRLIQGYQARLNATALGWGLVAFVFVRAEEPLGSRETEEKLIAIPEIQEVHHIAGEDCFLVKVRVRDTESLGVLLRDRLGAIPTIRSTRTSIVLATAKETLAVPVPAEREERIDA